MFGKRKGTSDICRRFLMTYGSRGAACMLVCAGILLAVSFAVRLSAGSPYEVMHRLHLWSYIPPTFIMMLIISFWYLLMGGVFGLCLGGCCRGREIEKYKGGMLFILLVVLELVWYPCFFVKTEVFFSLLLLLLCFLLCIGVTVCFWKVSGLCGVVMLFHCLWLLYLIAVNVLVLFHT